MTGPPIVEKTIGMLSLVNLFLLAWYACAAAITPGSNALSVSPNVPTPPLPIDEDPFYKAPPGIASMKPGSIIRYRPVPRPITIDNNEGVKLQGAWQILYRTHDSSRGPDATVVTLLVPFNAKPRHLFSLLYFSDAVYNQCNPSIVLQVGARNDSTFTQSQTIIALSALMEGYYVSIADDEGTQAAFATGRRMAYSTLDSVRAVQQSGNFTGIASDSMVAMYGYSGGGFVATWVAETQPTYAPELDIVGIAAGGLVPNLTAAFQLYNKNDRANFIPPGIIGIARDYQNLSRWLDENLKPELAAEFRKAETQCFDGNIMYSYQDIGKYFKRGWSSLFESLPASALHYGATLGQGSTPKVPLYIHETWWDDVSPISHSDALLRKYCDGGANILYERNDLVKTNHSEESIWGLPGAFTWIEERFSGRPVPAGCKVTAFTTQSFSAWITLRMVWKLVGVFLATLGVPVSGP